MTTTAAFLAADASDYWIPLAAILTAGAVGWVATRVARWLDKARRRAWREDVSAVVTDLMHTVVEPQLEQLRAQNARLQQTLDAMSARNDKQHDAVALRLDAVEKRLPPPPSGYLPPPTED